MLRNRNNLEEFIENLNLFIRNKHSELQEKLHVHGFLHLYLV